MLKRIRLVPQASNSLFIVCLNPQPLAVEAEGNLSLRDLVFPF